MTTRRLCFGYYPKEIDMAVGAIRIASLPALAEIVSTLECSHAVEGDWLYAPQRGLSVGADIAGRPYPERIFGLPKTHFIEIQSADDHNQLAFHVWALSLFTGMRLSSVEAGFLDATPIRPGKLVDFVLVGAKLSECVSLTALFWNTYRSDPKISQLFAGAVHSLFIAQNPLYLGFERFLFLYLSLDACYALTIAINHLRNNKIKETSHAKRVTWMCEQFGIPVPNWANCNASKRSKISELRNCIVHEALVSGEPFGFAVPDFDTDSNLTREMQALICRLLVRLLGCSQAAYVTSPVNTRQIYGLLL